MQCSAISVADPCNPPTAFKSRFLTYFNPQFSLSPVHFMIVSTKWGADRKGNMGTAWD